MFKHASCTFEDWTVKLALATAEKFIPTKTVVFSKKSILYLLVLDCNNNAKLSSIAKLLQKDSRIVAKDAIKSSFLCDPDHFSAFDIEKMENRSSLKLFVDKSLLDFPADQLLAFRISATESKLSKNSDFQTYLQSLSGGFESLDLSKVDSTTSSPAPKRAAGKVEKKVEATEDSANVSIGLTVKKDEDFSTWYTQVLTRTEMLDYYDISGCYIIRPWSFKIWKLIQNFFGGEIEEKGVEDCYFPMFVSARALNKEKDHIEGFAPEVAWVTKAGDSDLAEHIAVRPTSETVMYPSFSDWIRSHRDLPLKLNQWCNVVRWEFKNPQPFLRTREFLWQEGHTAFATSKEAEAEVLEILELYRRVYEELLAVPVIPGKKSEKEKFAGGVFTTTVEGFIPTTGRAIQGATSHHLGQNFAKMFNIMIENEKKERTYVWQNSWGLTTRTIGVMVMVHGDDKGLVLPPRVAAIQVVIIPVGITVNTKPEEKAVLEAKVDEIALSLKKVGLRVKADSRENYTPGYKYNHWEFKGVPLRLEVGPKDLAKNSTRVVRRDTGEAKSYDLATLTTSIPLLLEQFQHDLFTKAKKLRDERVIRLDSFDKVVETLDAKCLILSPWCERTVCEDDVKERSGRATAEADDKAPSMGAKTLCIPFTQPTDRPLVEGVTKCFACGELAKSFTLWGRSY